MRNFIKPGKVLTMVAPSGGAVSGNAYKIGAFFGVAAISAAEDEEFELNLEGVYGLPKPTAQAWAVGDPIFWDDTAKKVTTVSAGNTLVGAATAVALAADTVGNVRLSAVARDGYDSVALAVAMTVAAGAANVSEVTIKVVDAAGNIVPGVHHLDVWLSDDADGEGLTGTTASGTVQAKAASGYVLSTYTAKKALRVQTLKTGLFVLEITDTAKTAFKVAASLLGPGEVGLTLITANYG
jgi:predicted RecA/RadA family phage recombinase